MNIFTRNDVKQLIETISNNHCLYYLNKLPSKISVNIMGKVIKYGLIGIAGVLILGFIVLTLSVDSVVKSGIEDVGSEMTGTAVTVQNVSISPFSGEGTIRGFHVANPDDYVQEHLFKIEELSISLDLWSLFSDVIVVHEIIVMRPELYVEQKLPENNLATVMRNINRVEPYQASQKEMVIEYFLMEEGSAELYTEIGGERNERVELSSVELRDLGEGGGQRAVESIIKEIAEEVAKQGLQAAARSGGEQIRDAIRDLFN